MYWEESEAEAAVGLATTRVIVDVMVVENAGAIKENSIRNGTAEGSMTVQQLQSGKSTRAVA